MGSPKQRSVWRFGGYAIAGLVTVVGLVAAVEMATGRDAPTGYRLEVQTMVPEEVSIRPEELDCPPGRGPSPIRYADLGALTSDLPLYDGDLVAVRISVLPGTVSMPDEVRLTATWPGEVVGSGIPSCVFVLEEGGAVGAAVNWRVDGDGTTEFAILDPGESGSTIEIWLKADDPEDRASFQVEVVPENATDSVIVDGVGGRTTVRLRVGAPAEVRVEARRAGEGDGLEVVAVLTNPVPTSRALDIDLRLTSVGSATWAVVQDRASGGSCSGGSVVECSFDELGAGATAEVVAVLELQDDWSPTAVNCEAPPSDSGFGLCVTAETSSAQGTARANRAASVLVEFPRPTTNQLAIRTDPDPVVARAGTDPEFALTVTATGPSDLGSVDVTGSDCVELERVVQDLEDGDAFLEVDETWRFECVIQTEESPTFRFDVAAKDGAGAVVSASYEGVVRVIDPEIRLDINDKDGEIRVENTGGAVVVDVAALIPGCDAIRTLNGTPDLLEAGESVVFRCVEGVPDLSRATVYSTDELGLAVRANP